MPLARLAGPFAPSALPEFLATTSPSAPVTCIGTLLLRGTTTAEFSLRITLRITRQVPTFRTRACTGLTPPLCRSPCGQLVGAPRTPPSLRPKTGFDDTLAFSTRHQRFTCVRLPSSYLTESLSRLLRSRSPPGSLDPRSRAWFEPSAYTPSP